MKNEKHLAFIRSLPCIICENNIETEAAHVRFSDNRYFKKNPGVGQKPDDCHVLPLCGKHHREQHNYGDEFNWWEKYGKDPVRLALVLYGYSGDYERCEKIVSLQIFRKFLLTNR